MSSFVEVPVGVAPHTPVSAYEEDDDFSSDDDDFNYILEDRIASTAEKSGGFNSSKQFCQKYECKVDVGQYSKVSNDQLKKLDSSRLRERDKSDRATVEQVLDPRTRMILFKLISRRLVSEINGCISTGKEANVYHANSQMHGECAVKVYKTSILTFKDRDRYISGEFRFRNGYCRGNNRKMVQTWAEKELRNLTRFNTHNLPCPTPILLKGHVLLMTFLGDENGYPAPKLKDVNLSDSKLRELYLQIVRDMRIIGQAYYIDVSQSVEKDHPMALQFLRTDCTNITAFFRRNKISTMRVKELFDFITSPTIQDEDVDEYLDKMSEMVSTRSRDELDDEDDDENVFKNAFIPQTLDQVVNVERDIKKIQQGEKGDIFYESVVGIDLSKVQLSSRTTEEDTQNLSDTCSSSGDEEEDEDEKVRKEVPWMFQRPKEETAEERASRKQAVKQLQRENRQTKKPKKVKKREEKVFKSKTGKK